MSRKMLSALQGVASGGVSTAEAAKHICSLRARSPDAWTVEIEACARRVLVAAPSSTEADDVAEALAHACGLAETAAPDSGAVAGLVDFALGFLMAKDKGVRIRSARLVAAALAAAPADAEVDEEVWDRSREALIDATGDKVAAARAAACTALRRLQEAPADGEEEPCPATAQLRRLAAHDASREVRRAAITSLAVSHDTLPALLARTSDVDATVRAAAVLVLADRVSPEALTPTQRAAAVRRGAADDSKAVRDATRALLCRWLVACGGAGAAGGTAEERSRSAREAAAACVGLLDLEEDADAAAAACDLLFAYAARARPRDASQAEVWATVRLAVASGEPPSPAELTPALALLWRARCDWLRGRAAEDGPAGRAALQELEAVVPPLAALSAVIAGRVMAASAPAGAAPRPAPVRAAAGGGGDGEDGDGVPLVGAGDDSDGEAEVEEDDEDIEEEEEEAEAAGMAWGDAFVVRQLLVLASGTDLAEEAGRRRLVEACEALWLAPHADDGLVGQAATTHAAATEPGQHAAALAAACAAAADGTPLPVTDAASLRRAADEAGPAAVDGEDEWARALLLARLALAAAGAPAPDAEAAAALAAAASSVTDAVVRPAVDAAARLLALARAAPLPDGAALLAPALVPAAVAAAVQSALRTRRRASAALRPLASLLDDVTPVLVAAAAGTVPPAASVAALRAAAAAAAGVCDALLLWQSPSRRAMHGADVAATALARLAAGRAVAGSGALGDAFAEPSAMAAAAEPAVGAPSAVAAAKARTAAVRGLSRLLACRRLGPLDASTQRRCAAAAVAVYCSTDASGAEAAAEAVEVAAAELAEAAVAAGADADDIDADAIAAEMTAETGAADALEADDRARQELTLALPALAAAGPAHRAALAAAAAAAARGLADAARFAAAYSAELSGAKGKRARAVAAADADVVESVFALAGFLTVSGAEDGAEAAPEPAASAADSAADAEAAAPPAAGAGAAREGAALHAAMVVDALVDVAAEPKGPFAGPMAKAAAGLDASGVRAAVASFLADEAVEGGALKGVTKSLRAAEAAAEGGGDEADEAAVGEARAAVARRADEAAAAGALASRLAEGECGRTDVGEACPGGLAALLGDAAPQAGSATGAENAHAGVVSGKASPAPRRSVLGEAAGQA